MNNKTIQRIILLGALAVIFVIASQTYMIMQAYDLKERDFNASVHISLLGAAKELSAVNQTILPPNLVKRLSKNTYAVNVNSKINATNLDFFLRKNFEAAGLNEDFDYAIYDCHDEKMVYGKYVSYSASSRDSLKVEKNLPTLSDATYYFVVRFPKRESSIFSGISFMLVFTAISLLTVIFFIYAMTVILRQKRLSELQKDFINNMTHEFKTPISTIKVAADVFASNPAIQSDVRLSRYAQIIREQNNRLNSQVEKVLQITRIDKNTLDLTLEVINLHELLDSILPSIQVKIEEKKGILNQELHATQPYIKADTLHLTNILHNLLDNAMKYCKDGKPDITIKTFDVGKNMRLVVEDKGIGIDKEHHKKVFFRFYRVPTGNIHNVKGFGLGLFYVKNIISAHGWTIDLDSEVGLGTKIVMDIPKAIQTTVPSKFKESELYA